MATAMLTEQAIALPGASLPCRIGTIWTLAGSKRGLRSADGTTRPAVTERPQQEPSSGPIPPWIDRPHLNFDHAPLPASMRTPNLFLLLVTAASLAACSSDATSPRYTEGPAAPDDGETPATAITDAALFTQATDTGSWVWYKNSQDTLAPAANSPHSERLRTRYNTLAAIGLDGTGRVTAGTIFQDGALIVKEVYEDGALLLLAVMMKATGDPNAGHGAWVWAEYGPNGSVLHSLTQDEETCHSCHIGGVDHTRMSDAHP